MHRNPDNLHAPRELIRTRLAYIASLGFKAKDVILALEKFKKESVKLIFMDEFLYVYKTF